MGSEIRERSPRPDDHNGQEPPVHAYDFVTIFSAHDRVEYERLRDPELV
jgi:hypothetical protein